VLFLGDDLGNATVGHSRATILRSGTLKRKKRRQPVRIAGFRGSA